MRTQYRYLSFEKNLRLRKALDKLGFRYAYTEKSIGSKTFFVALECLLYEDNPAFDAVRELLANAEIEPQIASELEPADFDAAEWFITTAGEFQYPQPEAGFGYLERTFDLGDYCRNCGIGKLQTAPFRLQRFPQQFKNQFWGIHWEHNAVFLRPTARRLLELGGISGCDFSPVVLHKSGQEIPDFYQLRPEVTLAAGFDARNAQVVTCRQNIEDASNPDSAVAYCSRIKFQHPLVGGNRFDKSIFIGAGDIVLTHEYFGSGAQALQQVVVSRRFKNLVENNHLKGLKFIPVFH